MKDGLRENNFLVVMLCDNDYGATLKEVLEYLWVNENWQRWDTFIWKNSIINCYAAARLQRNCMGNIENNLKDMLKYCMPYLKQTLRVTFEETRQKTVDSDHDGGSCAIDLHTGFAWTF